MRAQYMREEFSPLLHPEEHRATAIKFMFLWIALFPWIDAGIVSFVRPLHDFIPNLWHEVLRIQRERFEGSEQLKKILEGEVSALRSETGPFDGGMGEYMFLSMPDEVFRRDWEAVSAKHSDNTSVDEFLEYIQKRREMHPYYVDPLPGQTGELFQESSGACYELAKRMCAITNSHIATNLPSRWKEVEIDREQAGIDLQGWSPFAKVLQDSDLKVLNNVPMQAALSLRKDNRLESLRLFLRKVWRTCRDPDEFSAENVVNFSSELQEEIGKANEEWKKIDQQLLKWFGATGGALITSGVLGFVPAASAAAVTGVTGLIQAQMKRSAFKDRYPAGFFVGVKNKH
jgi:hypothetical protein